MVQQIRCDRMIMIGVGRRDPELGAAIGCNSCFPHAFCNGVSTANDSSVNQFPLHARTAIGVLVLYQPNRMNLVDDLHLLRLS